MENRAVSTVAALLALAAAMLGTARAAEFELPEARAQLSPTGKMRVAVVAANSALASVEQGSGELGGLAGDLARAIAEKIGVPLQPRIYLTPKTFEGSLGVGDWDVVIGSRVPRYARYVDFSANFVLVEQAYLVGPGKSLKEMSEIDRKGVRVAATEDSDAETYLFDTLKNAQLLRVPIEPDAASRLLQSGAAEVYGDSLESVTRIAARLPGARLMPGRFAAIPAAVGVARGRPSALAFVNEFLREAKASGRIRRWIEVARLHGIEVATP